MTFRAKHTVTVWVLAAITVWPLVHHGGVRALDLYPWKWFGWSMYTVPPYRVRARAVSVETGEQVSAAGLPPVRARAVLAAYQDFSERRMQFSDRIEPDDFAAALLRAHPQVKTIAIYIQEVRVDRSTALVSQYRLSDPPYTYQRDGSGIKRIDPG